MSSSAWDLLPEVVLEREDTTGISHVAPGSCSDLSDLRPRYDITLSSVSLRDAAQGTNGLVLCGAPECRALLSSSQYATILSTVQRLGLLSDLEQEPDPLVQVCDVTEAWVAPHAWVQPDLEKVGHALLREAALALRDRLDARLQGTVELFRTTAWRAEFFLALGEVYPEADHEEVGVLVAERANLHSGSVLLTALCSYAGDRSRMVVAPMFVLQHVVDVSATRPSRPQVASLPEGLSPQLVDTVLGLFDPSSTGPMSDLVHVLVAARGVLA